MKTLRSLLLAAAATLPVAAHADSFIANVGWAPTHIITKNAYLDFAESLKAASKGDMELEVFTGGSLISVKETLQGVADGIAQIGFVTGAYLPADLPLDNVIADMAFIADDPIAAAFAFTEVNFTQAKLRDEWLKHGVVFGGGYSTPVYNFICTTRIAGPDDLKGKKIRTAGAAHVRWVEHVGGVPVSVPFSEVYTGLQRGSIDCAMSDPTALVSGFKVAEVAKFITMLPMGTHTSGATYVMNADFWADLSPARKAMLFDQMALAIARMEVDYEAQVSENLKGGAELGVEQVAPSAALTAMLAAFNEEYVRTLPEVEMKSRGVADPSDIIAAYAAAEQRWKKLIATVDRTDAAALAGLLRSEVYGKLDLATYGKQ